MSDEIKTEAEFLRSAALDIVTQQPLEDSARAEVYAIDARRIAATIEALEAEIERLRAEIDALRNPPEEYCARCGAPKSNHPYRHPFLSMTLNQEPDT